MKTFKTYAVDGYSLFDGTCLTLFWDNKNYGGTGWGCFVPRTEPIVKEYDDSYKSKFTQACSEVYEIEVSYEPEVLGYRIVEE